jgi:5-deoxy-glucuronate isomerase
VGASPTETAIHRSALPNLLASDDLRIRPGPDDPTVSVDPDRASWRYLSFRAIALAAGETVDAGIYGQEAVVVVIGGGGVRVDIAEHSPMVLPGRSGPFEALPWAAYLPPDVPGRVVGRPDGTRGDGRVLVAIAEAPRLGIDHPRGRPVLIGPDEVEVEVRGAGNATRQINKIVQPGFAADRLEVVEVLTPSGNWSSWPPHKHDTDHWPDEAVLEEVYYYQFARPEAWGVQRLYRADRSRDCLWAVGNGELVLVTDGYHPFVAAHGWDAYYLNALAGDRRTMACSYDPDLDWTRAAWADLAADRRVPLVPPSGTRPSNKGRPA